VPRRPRLLVATLASSLLAAAPPGATRTSSTRANAELDGAPIGPSPRSVIATLRESARGLELWAIAPEGGERRRVTDLEPVPTRLGWSADGGTIFFSSRTGAHAIAYGVPLRGGFARVISDERGLNAEVAASPDGRALALTLSRDGMRELYKLDTTSGRLSRLTQEWTTDASPTWSPDGRRIAFVSTRRGPTELFAISADGTGPEQLTALGLSIESPDWSPKGDAIVFSARAGEGAADLYRLILATRQIERLTSSDEDERDPSHSPDGRQLVFSAARAGQSDLYLLDLEAVGARRRITAERNFFAPRWSPELRHAAGPGLSAADR
jgi:TolB protein